MPEPPDTESDDSESWTAAEPAAAASTLRRRFDRIYSILRTRICLLDYRPGERLSEESLAKEFKVSRTPVRRVPGRLEVEGLLRSLQGIGTIVSDIDINELTQVYQLRFELAELLGKLSPITPDTATIARFRWFLSRADDLVQHPDAREFAKLNMDYSLAAVRLTTNEPLREISERLYFQTTRIWLKTVSCLDLPDEISVFRRQIADTLAALEVGDLSALGHIQRAHISMSFTRLRNGASAGSTAARS